MTPPKRNPTNADIMQKLESMDRRIKSLEDWKIAVEAAKQALKEFKANQPEQSISTKALVAVIAALTTLGAAVVTLIGKL